MSGIFLDSANLDELKKWFDTGIIKGATTNPVILQKDNVLNIPKHLQNMIDIVGRDFPISIELPDSQMDEEEMVALAKAYKDKFPLNTIIKVPLDPRDMPKALRIIKKLKAKWIGVNATLGLTAGQLIAAMEAGANYVSLFWSRCDEVGGIGAEQTLKTVMNYRTAHQLPSNIIIGSIRNIGQINKAYELGADIVTIPPKLLGEWMFTQRGVETADEFNKAYRDIKNKITLI
jgi:transaldolase